MNEFLIKLEKLTKEKKSKIIIAIDEEKFLRISFLKKFSKYAVGFKFGIPVLLTKFLKIKKLINKINENFVIIADLKVADIPYISLKIGEVIKNAGFDAIISHCFVGIDTLKSLILKIPTIAVISMTHEDYYFNFHVKEFIKICEEAKVSGIVVPGNKPKILKEIRKITKLRIFSPGIGIQGASYGSAIKNGADYEIIGRSILNSKNPILEIKKALSEIYG